MACGRATALSTRVRPTAMKQASDAHCRRAGYRVRRCSWLRNCLAATTVMPKRSPPHIERAVIPLPRTPDPRRRVENLDAFGFALIVEETARIRRSLPRQRIPACPRIRPSGLSTISSLRPDPVVHRQQSLDCAFGDSLCGPARVL